MSVLVMDSQITADTYQAGLSFHHCKIIELNWFNLNPQGFSGTVFVVLMVSQSPVCMVHSIRLFPKSRTSFLFLLNFMRLLFLQPAEVCLHGLFQSCSPVTSLTAPAWCSLTHAVCMKTSPALLSNTK